MPDALHVRVLQQLQTAGPQTATEIADALSADKRQVSSQLAWLKDQKKTKHTAKRRKLAGARNNSIVWEAISD